MHQIPNPDQPKTESTYQPLGSTLVGAHYEPETQQTSLARLKLDVPQVMCVISFICKTLKELEERRIPLPSEDTTPPNLLSFPLLQYCNFM